MTNPTAPTYIYLHGFASGPSSTKAQFFAAKLQELGVTVEVLDLNQPSFEAMTLSSQLEIIASAIAQLDRKSPVILIGSSMGGLLATLCAQKYEQIRGMVLLAPGFGLPRRWNEMLGPTGLLDWRVKGHVDVFHHALNKNVPLHYGFIEDAQKYQTDNLEISVPTLVFHGSRDETVPVEESIFFARRNPGRVKLHVLNADHQLIEPLSHVWSITQAFLDGNELVQPIPQKSVTLIAT